jgi:hypothetical protein
MTDVSLATTEREAPPAKPPLTKKQKVARMVLWAMMGIAAIGLLFLAVFLANPTANRWLQMEIFQRAERAEMRARIALIRPECPSRQAGPSGEDLGCALFMTLADGRVAQITRVQIVDESSLVVYGLLSPLDGADQQITSQMIRPAADYQRGDALYGGSTSAHLGALFGAWALQPATPRAEAP